MPTKKTKTVEITYWDCGNPKHCHRTLDVAKRCEAKKARKTANLTFHQGVAWPKRLHRKLAIAEAIISGKTGREAGKAAGISGPRALSIVPEVLGHVRRKFGKPPFEDEFHYPSLKEVREHASWWLERISQMKTYSAQH